MNHSLSRLSQIFDECVSRYSDCGHDSDGDFSKGNTCAGGGSGADTQESKKQGIQFKRGTRKYNLDSSALVNTPKDGSKLYICFFNGEPIAGVFADHRDLINGEFRENKHEIQNKKYKNVQLRDLDFEQVPNYKTSDQIKKKSASDSKRDSEFKSKIIDVMKNFGEPATVSDIGHELGGKYEKPFDRYNPDKHPTYKLLKELENEGLIEYKEKHGMDYFKIAGNQ